MTKLIVWLKSLSIIKKVGIALAVILVLFVIAGVANLGKFSEKPRGFKTKQPIKLERDKSVKKDPDKETRRGLGEGKEAEDQAASENVSKTKQPPTQSQQGQTTAEQPPAQSQSQTTGEPQTQPAPSGKTSPETAPAPETSNDQTSVSSAEDDDGSSSPAEANFVGSIKTMIYHTPDCPLAKKIPPEEQIWFSSPEEAIDLEYNPCTMCATPN